MASSPPDVLVHFLLKPGNFPQRDLAGRLASPKFMFVELPTGMIAAAAAFFQEQAQGPCLACRNTLNLDEEEGYDELVPCHLPGHKAKWGWRLFFAP